MPKKKNNIIIVIGALIFFMGGIVTVASFLGLLGSCYENLEYLIKSEPKSNLEAIVITKPPEKITKDSDVIFEFNICNIGKTGEQYNYSLEMRHMKLKYEKQLEGSGTLNDGEPCEEIEYVLFAEPYYSSKTYPEISFSLHVNSESKNKLLLSKNYEYSLNEDGLYELNS